MSFKEDKPRSRGKILIVDDDADFIEIEKVVLQKEGYDIAVAYNGEECIQKVDEDPPDLIILDIAMQTSYEGADVAQVLRDRQDTRHIPIIVVTSQPVQSIYPEDMWYPTDVFLRKPVDRYELIEKVNNIFKNK
ncbi:two-component system response regulator [Thermodesulfobacteriota bacterium]